MSGYVALQQSANLYGSSKSAGRNWIDPAVGGSDPREIRLFCERRYSQLTNEFTSWRTHQQDLADFISPRRGRLYVHASEGSRGAKVGHKILDPTATKAAQTLASGMLSGLTSPSRPWFVLGVADPELSDHAPVRAWLDVVRQRMLSVFAGSNVYTTLHSLYMEEGVFGQGVMLVTEDHEDVIRCYHMQAGEFLLGNSSRLDVNTLYRHFVLTVQQLVEQFGYDACSAGVQAQYDIGSLTSEREVIHAIEPNPARTHNKLPKTPPGWMDGFAAGFPFRSVYFERGGDADKVLSQSGYHEQPFMAPRWQVFGNDVYGRSPGMDALPNVRQLQVMQRKLSEGVGKLVDPPLIAPISMQNAEITALPGGVSYLKPDDAGTFKPLYQVQFRPESLQPIIDDKRNDIRGAFFADLFLMISQMDGQPVTAEEIRVRQEEKMLMLGPVVERNQNELLDPLIERTFGIMLRKRLVPPPPQEIRGQALNVTYVSVLAQAQRATSTTSIERLAAFVGNLAQTKPEAAMKFDAFEAIDVYGEALLVPAGVIVDTAKAQAMLAAQQKAQQSQQQAAQMGQSALAAAQGAKTLSETDVGGGQQALAAILGNGPSPGVAPGG